MLTRMGAGTDTALGLSVHQPSQGRLLLPLGETVETRRRYLSPLAPSPVLYTNSRVLTVRLRGLSMEQQPAASADNRNCTARLVLLLLKLGGCSMTAPPPGLQLLLLLLRLPFLLQLLLLPTISLAAAAAAAEIHKGSGCSVAAAAADTTPSSRGLCCCSNST